MDIMPATYSQMVQGEIHLYYIILYYIILYYIIYNRERQRQTGNIQRDTEGERETVKVNEVKC